MPSGQRIALSVFAWTLPRGSLRTDTCVTLGQVDYVGIHDGLKLCGYSGMTLRRESTIYISTGSELMVFSGGNIR